MAQAQYSLSHYTGERALFQTHDAHIAQCTFDDGESPLKESSDLDIEMCTFGWKYPLWYDRNVKVRNTTWLDTARSGVWYTHNISVENCSINAPKNFRRCSHVNISHSTFFDAQETLWNCSDVTLTDVNVRGDYFGMNSEHLHIDGLTLDGNYGFDGAKDIEIRNSRLTTKDALWNCENVTVYDSVITGEYLGWNSQNLTFINCTIESNQGLCYIEGLTLKNCVLRDTTLAFEYCSHIDAEITSTIDSVKNPISGTISAPGIGEIIRDDDALDKTATTIEVKQQR